MAVAVEQESDTNLQHDNGDALHKGRRLFSRLMKQECWKMAKSVPGRDPSRWKYDAVGNIVCNALTSCTGPLCHEYDHIVPHSKGGETSVENCQILQTRINRIKSDAQVESMQAYRSNSIIYNFTDEELDLVEIAVYGNVTRSIPGPLPGLNVTTVLCECLNNGISSKTSGDTGRPLCDRTILQQTK